MVAPGVTYLTCGRCKGQFRITIHPDSRRIVAYPETWFEETIPERFHVKRGFGRKVSESGSGPILK
jgi:hypothetical protein